MFAIDAAYRREGGKLVFIHEDRSNEATDDLCDLRVRFEITAIYPAEADTGAGMDWNGDIASIEMRAYSGHFKNWRVLHGDQLEAAKAFLLLEYGRQLWEAGGDYAQALHYGEAA